jgi:prepilin-type N-terminal cleavage/methylation domain-containing protein
MRNRQNGFTLMEVMASAAATGIVMLAGSAVLIRGLGWYDEISSKIEMNRHARLAFELWAYGGMSSTNGKDGTKYVYGIRGSHTQPPKGDLRTPTGTLIYKQNNITLTVDTFAAMRIACKGNNIPVPQCKDLNPVSVTGWLGDDPDIKKKAGSIGEGWATISFTITNPFQAQRGPSGTPFTDTYQTVFTLNRMENDP